MKMSNIKSAPRFLRPNYANVFVTMTLVLFLSAMVAALILLVRGFSIHQQENIQFVVELRDETDSSHYATDLRSILDGAKYVKAGSLHFASKEDALREMQEYVAESPFQFESSPFFANFSFNIRADYANEVALERIVLQLEKLPAVLDAYYENSQVRTSSGLLRNLSIAATFMLILLGIVAFTVLNHTLKLALYANRFEIKTMQLVGASWQFIRRPYLFRVLKIGFMSAVVALALLGCCVAFTFERFRIFYELVAPQWWVGIAFFVLSFGIAVPYFTTRRTLLRYFKSSSEQLFS